jgi:hypothetical protein
MEKFINCKLSNKIIKPIIKKLQPKVNIIINFIIFIFKLFLLASFFILNYQNNLRVYPQEVKLNNNNIKYNREFNSISLKGRIVRTVYKM